jgi:hypothetical protein
MKFYYGYDEENRVEITEKVEEHCLVNNFYLIPNDDNLRAKIFGDPYYGKLKMIWIDLEIVDQKMITCPHNQSILFSKNITSVDQIHQTNIKELRKLWWENKGKYIPDVSQKLLGMQNWIMYGYTISDLEWEEQIMAITYLDPKDKVLELGSNYGKNTCLIASLLEDDRNLVTLETCQAYIPGLEYNRNINLLQFQIEPSGISRKKLIQKKWITTQWEMDTLPDSDYFWVPTITWSDLKKKYPIDFNVLVADCEGALFYILQEEPDFLDRFQKIFVENDYIRMEQYEFVKKKMEEKGFRNVFNLGGGLSWHCCKDCFYQVWIR